MIRTEQLETRRMLAYIDLNESEFNILDASAFPSGAIVIGQGTVAGVPDPLAPNFEFSRRFDLPFLRSDGVLEVYGDDSAETFVVTPSVGVDASSPLASIVYTEEPTDLANVLVFGSASASIANLLDGSTTQILEQSLAGITESIAGLEATLALLIATGNTDAAANVQSTLASLTETAGNLASAIEQLQLIPTLIDDEAFVRVTRSDGYTAYVPQTLFSGISVIGGGGDDFVDLRGAPTLAGAWVDGGTGNDILHGSYGRSTLLGGDGNDRLFAYAPTGVADGGAGIDTLQTTSPSGGWVIRNVEVVEGRFTEGRRLLTSKPRAMNIRNDILMV